MKLDEIICEQLAQDSSWPLQGMAPRLIRLRRSVTELEQRLASLERSVEGEDLKQLVLAASSDQLDQESGIDEEWPERTKSEERSQTAPCTPRKKPDRRVWQDVESGDEDIFAVLSPRNGDLYSEIIENGADFNEISPRNSITDKRIKGKSSPINGNHKNSLGDDSLDVNLSNKKTLGDITVCEAALEELLNEQGLIEKEISQIYTKNDALSKPKVANGTLLKKKEKKAQSSQNSSDNQLTIKINGEEHGVEKKMLQSNTAENNSTSVGECQDRCQTTRVEKKNPSHKNEAPIETKTAEPTKNKNKKTIQSQENNSTKRRTDKKQLKSSSSDETELRRGVNKASNIPSDSNNTKTASDSSKLKKSKNQIKNSIGNTKVSKSRTKKADHVQEPAEKKTDCAAKLPMVGTASTAVSRKVKPIKVTAKAAQSTVGGVSRRDADDKSNNKSKGKKKVKQMLFYINCEQPARDEIFDVNDFVVFLKAKFKVGGRVNNLSRAVTFNITHYKVTITTRDLTFSKRYLKYLSKKYLQKKGLRDWLRVVSPGASSGDTYDLRYYKCTGLEDSDDES